LNGDELREEFLKYFEEKGHKRIDSSALIPHDDPTLLLTNAGMVQFKPYFLGESKPPSKKMTSCQKCFRTTDIESAGDSSHLTFFEMLGNFSVGDYFKKEAIAWAWEFVTERLKLDPERLWITVFKDDDEAFKLWHETGVPGDRILRFGSKDNFWGPAGDCGPCGPCSEIHYDFGEEAGCGRQNCAPNCDCGRFSEIWNLVFIQYDQDKKGKRINLPDPSIDTGMGLERTAAVMQGATNVYQTDLFTPLINKITQISGKKYGRDGDTDTAIRIAAEHGRGLAFLIADGVLPANDGRGYVLRRLLRRAALFGRKLGLTEPFLAEIADVVIEKMKHIYPELEKRRDFILELIETGETRFDQTLVTGLELLEDAIKRPSSKMGSKISGKEAFKLYDTYGFPVELTSEIARQRGFSVDMEGFAKEMSNQREKARASHRFELDAEADLKEKLELEASRFTGQECLKGKSKIYGLLVANEPLETISQGQEADIILEETPFYAEMGGQVGDTGVIKNATGEFIVSDTRQGPSSTIIHRGKVKSGELKMGNEVEADVDGIRRLDIARNHTATHLLQYALREVLGEHIQQRGSVVAADRLRFDFCHLKAMVTDEIKQVEQLVNEKIRQNLSVYDEQMNYKEALDGGAIALFGEKYSETVRVLKVGRPLVSIELCGGIHIGATGEIGLFRIVSEGSIGAGLRRIEAVTGRGAETWVSQEFDRIGSEADKLKNELDEAHKEIQSLQTKLAIGEAKSLMDKAEQIKGITVVASRVAPTRPDNLRVMADSIRDNLKSVIVVLATIHQDNPFFLSAVTPDLIKKGYNAGKIIKEVTRIAGGGGGGKPDIAQGGGKDKSKIEEALKAVGRLV